ncbi:hypothetical protein NDU88_006315 [Pleurodeles waltl]|uniref:Uncharacterized protein n=1 Tax=Pleurodeles waltl TaxID=8319 RepID=A0AAV7LNR9_PLEWA|nr:hypothetical protein NDU88_006315 [Pleurodeles waltl]
MVRRKSSKTGEVLQALPPSNEILDSHTRLLLSAQQMVHNANARFAELLTAVQSLKPTLEPKLYTLIFDMRHMQDDNKN